MPLPGLNRITDVALFVSDLQRAIAFYRDRMALELKRLDTGFAEFWMDGAILALWEEVDVRRALDFADAARRGPHAMLAIRTGLGGGSRRCPCRAGRARRGLPFSPADLAMACLRRLFQRSRRQSVGDLLLDRSTPHGLTGNLSGRWHAACSRPKRPLQIGALQCPAQRRSSSAAVA